MSTRSTNAEVPLATPDGKFVAGHVPAIDDYRSVMVQRAVFQSIASMGLPAFTIHSIVRYSGRYLKNAKNTRIRTYGPIGVCIISWWCWSRADRHDSLAWLLSHFSRLFSTSRSRKRWSGVSTKGLRSSVVLMRLLISQRLGELLVCCKKPQRVRIRRRSCKSEHRNDLKTHS